MEHQEIRGAECIRRIVHTQRIDNDPKLYDSVYADVKQALIEVEAIFEGDRGLNTDSVQVKAVDHNGACECTFARLKYTALRYPGVFIKVATEHGYKVTSKLDETFYTETQARDLIGSVVFEVRFE